MTRNSLTPPRVNFRLVVALLGGVALAEAVALVLPRSSAPVGGAALAWRVLLLALLASPLLWWSVGVPLRRAMRMNRGHAQAAVHGAHEAMLTINGHCHITWMNPAAERMFGLTAAQAVGRSCTLLVPPGDREGHHHAMQELVSAGFREPASMEMEMQRGDGHKFPASITLTPSHADDTPLYVTVVRDISREQEAARIRTEAEALFRMLARAIPVGAYHTDTNGHCLYVNERWCQITGLTQAEAAIDGWSDALHPDDRERVFRLWREAATNRTPFHAEYRFRRPDGAVTWVLGQADAVVDGQGRISGYVGSVTDITEKIASESRLRESEQDKADLLNSLQDTVFRVAENGSIRWISPSATSLFNQPATRLLNRPFADLCARPEQVAHLEQRLETEGGRVRNMIIPVLRQDGTQRWVSVHAQRWQHPTGGTGIQGSMRDVTDQKLAEYSLLQAVEEMENRVRERTAELQAATHEAEAANRAKGEFLSRMSHELRTPLNAILGFAQLAEAEAQERGDGAGEETVREILQAGNHLLELINDVLDLSRIEAGNMRLRVESVNVVDISNHIVTLLMPLAERFGVTLIPPRPIEETIPKATILVDPTRLRQVLINLVSNAIKYNHPGGEAWIGCSSDPDTGHVTLEVGDNGRGIPEKLQSRLFEPFNRLGAESTPVEGTGIGLVITRGLTELMGGYLRFESRPEHGSRFWITFPSAPPDATAQKASPPGLTATNLATKEPQSAPPSNPTQERPRSTVLYVEDNTQNTILMRRILESRSNTSVLCAKDGASGIQSAITHRPGLILLDINLPDQSGFDVLRQLRAHPATRSTPVVAVSADGFPEAVKNGLVAGFDDYITKPVDVLSLLALVDTLLARKETSPQADATDPSGAHATPPPSR
ncbi:MAG: PAS domain S-box protein [Nitrospirota bacterium]|nr:PAS domain S-box protein [Nitrospirota bacterium]